MWQRSIPTDPNLKLTRKAKAITNKNIEGCSNKNCYILYADEESVKKAIIGANNKLFANKHLHVTSGAHIERDFKTTVFVGNLPYHADEEEIREFFGKVGSVEYVRVVRDKVTFQSQGFCYVKFQDREAVLKALEIKEKFKERYLRISKARKSTFKNKDKSENKSNALNRIGKKKFNQH